MVVRLGLFSLILRRKLFTQHGEELLDGVDDDLRRGGLHLVVGIHHDGFGLRVHGADEGDGLRVAVDDAEIDRHGGCAFGLVYQADHRLAVDIALG